ncbi:MAG: YjbQ family protein [Clostridia bacterium]|nr:YjbQ family protein [Clostridia bacterium]
MEVIHIRTTGKSCMIDITGQVREIIAAGGMQNGIAVVFAPHTTAGITINENADPDVRADILMKLGRMVPDEADYRHSEGNSPAHVKALLTGASVSVIVSESRLLLGTWQGIYFCEYDGPRDRKVYVELIERRISHA